MYIRDLTRIGYRVLIAPLIFCDDVDLEVTESERKIRQLYQGTMEDADEHVRILIGQVQDVLRR